ncbi:DUF4302 domain-containing protein [Sphingobacterium sp. DK4209]|uniref:DUF4302 domain-containing protein n=1 Tax=Sphingobacterium zhuxiongii TaxID=2662364 RepID=A0A5Q0Q815_9SPHI|nr:MULTISPECIES: DUF4302 domain-containing protein [unclassified Sphingobacterium]MVZ66247.1 DUF4302 domain-containing protein [Sphingobacterium sp. DK4209]QGA24971.1 DUF4302 domain-containing protein [Sphingobacterium sp. dk4302]
MKSIIYYIALFCFAFLFSCTKSNDVELINGDPKERINDTINMVKSALVDAPNGWKAYVSTDVGKEFGFYMTFAENDRLKMYADINDDAAITSKESTYRVRQIMAATLVFDTYSYITTLQDPNGAVNGGKNGVGLGSDVEFEYRYMRGDSIVFQGRKFDEPLVLVKASEAEKKKFEAADYLKTIQKITQDLGLLSSQVVDINGKKYNVSINRSSKMVTLIHITSDGKSEIINGYYSYSIDGVEFVKGVEVNGVMLKSIGIKADKYAVKSIDNKEFNIAYDVTATLPLEMIYGFDKSIKTFGSIGNTNTMPKITQQTTFDKILSGITTKFGTVKFRYFTLKMDSRTKMSVNVHYTSSADFTATMIVDYTISNGVITISNPSGNTTGNWDVRRSALREFEDYLLNNKSFKLEWVPTTDGPPAIGWRSTTNPNDLIYGFPI